MIDIDVVKLEGMLFQLDILSMTRELRDVCEDKKDCVEFMGEVCEKLQDLASTASELYLSRWLSSGGQNILLVVDESILNGLFKNSVEKITPPKKMYGKDLWNLFMNFKRIYKEIYRGVVFEGVEDGFTQIYDLDFEYDEDLEAECPGYELNDYLYECGCVVGYGGDLEMEDSYTEGMFVYTLEIKNKCLCKALSITKNMEQERLFIKYYIEGLIFHIYGLEVIAMVENENEIKIIALEPPRWDTDKKFIINKFHVLPKLMLMKSYIEKHILKKHYL